MKLITVEAKFSAETLDNAIAAFEASAQAVCAMAGCQTYTIYSSNDAASIVIVQKWASMEQFDAYRGSAAFAEIGKSLKPMMTAPPITTVASVDG
ncbi:quinol monooxygenase YgiN [Aliiruegeria haliotis]|uniref:Quinol monooxygenase YgiN n=1 Tax=Aliiruegeria haliotis TaxID=1280846 RepID=A0A2T0RGV6_9RHOB|nr:antibiotic biosynthesis monooxygenase [Aliiruegeria haliotis]PRY20434.1 quinol monooxygenase YgiN [Aliiruegeria haliotis]